VLGLAACNGPAQTNTAINAALTTNTTAAPPAETRADAGPGMAPPASQPEASAPNPMPEGFYRLQDVEGDYDGVIAALCYAHGIGTEQMGERISYTDDPYPCTPQVRRVSADGSWEITQSCNLSQGHTTYTTSARREPNGDYTVRVAGVLDNGQPPANDHPRGQRVRRIGDCPQGWRPGDYLDLTRREADGVWRVHRVQHSDDVSLTFDELPDYLTALLNH
jgi:hypothetical protein